MKRLLQRSIVLLTIGVCVLVIGIAVAAAQGPGNTEPAQPTPIPQTKITMVAGNAATGVGMEVETSIRQALAHARDDNVLPTVNYFAISAPPWVADKWLFISVVAFEKLDAKLGWKLDDASWFGVVLIHQDDSGRLTAAVEGTIEFSQFLVQVPETILSAEAKQHLDPLQRSLMSSAAYRFPWQSGTRMQYGSLGVHSAGYGPTWGTWDWKAVDFVSDGSAGRAPNRLLAAATGAIGGVCNDGTSVAIKVDNLIYAHLLNNSNLHTGHYFDQGYVIGVLKTGTFHWPTPPPGSCGRASQAANNFHVHWGFPNNTFQVEGWTLNPSDGSSAQWRRGNETVGVTGWMLAGSGGGQPPAAPSNLSATVVSSSQINLSWQDNSNNETGFKVERKTGAGGTWNEIATVGAGVRTYQNTGLAANTTYYYRVRAYNSYGNSAYSNEAGATTPNITCPVYRAAYYDNRNLSGSPKFIQCEDWPINHDWGSGGPGNGVGNDNFSARWTGRASIAAGTYTFIGGADDGIKVWLDGNLIINEWHWQHYTEYRVTRSFSSSGYHDIQVEYYENEGAARVFFKWEQAQGCSGSPISLNQTVRGTIGSSGQRDTYCLTVSSGQWISIRMVGNPGWTTNKPDPVLEVYNPSGSRIGYSDDGDFVRSSTSVWYRDSFLSVWLPSAGTYRIIARMYSGTGSYAMRVESGREAAPGDLNRDCTINSLDYSILTSRLGSSDPYADLTLDGIVNSIDSAILQANWGRGCTAAAIGPTQEKAPEIDRALQETEEQIEVPPTPARPEP